MKSAGAESPFSLYQVPSLGGASKKVIEQVDSAVAFSPDGGRLAFLRQNPDQGETTLVIVNADGTERADSRHKEST